MSIIQAMHVDPQGWMRNEPAEVGNQPCRSMQVANGPNSRRGPTAQDWSVRIIDG